MKYWDCFKKWWLWLIFPAFWLTSFVDYFLEFGITLSGLIMSLGVAFIWTFFIVWSIIFGIYKLFTKKKKK